MNQNRILLIILFVFSLLYSQKAYSQSNLGDIKVDQLSEAQVRDLMRRAQSIGYNDAQLAQMALAQGMTLNDVGKLQKRIEYIRRKDSQSASRNQRNNQQNLQGRGYQGYNNPRYGAQSYQNQYNPIQYNRSQYNSNQYDPNQYNPNQIYPNQENSTSGTLNIPVLGNQRNTSYQNNRSRRYNDPNQPSSPYIQDSYNQNINGYSQYSEYYPYSNYSDTLNYFDYGNQAYQDNILEQAFQDLRPKIFGADLFRNSNISFQPNLNMPTPKGYIIGPGDELLVDLTGDNEASYSLTVSPEGSIYLEYAGQIQVGGLSIEAASSKIKSVLSRTYPALQSGRTQVSLNLGNIRSIQVTLLGEVTKPGSYTLPSLASVFNALYASGGPNENGSFRNIEVIRNNKIISTIDVYDFLLKGMQNDNIRLQDQDIIRVPVFQTRIEIAGEIKRPALYEIKGNESLQDALDFAGGFSTQAYSATVKVFQNTQKERKITDVFKEDFASYHPQNGDKYLVEAILDRFENRVEINGAVFRPGAFELDPGLTLKKLIEKADGLTEDAFLPRGYILRLNQDNTQSLLSFDVREVVNGTAADIPLKREDIVQISSIFDLRDEYKVTIQGEVRYPDTLAFAENMTVGSLIQMAGGFKEGASPNRIEIARRLKNIDVTSSSAQAAEVFTINIDPDLNIHDRDFVLQPFDIVSVRGESGFDLQMQVKLEGEVLHPGTYTITKKDERISDVIQRAGGLTAFAYAEGASLKRPSSETQKSKSAPLNSPLTEEDEIRIENERRLLNLRRLSQDGTTPTLTSEDFEVIESSDLVGINLEKILDKPHTKLDLFLEDGDIIRVPKTLQTVKITGEVLRPNNIVYNSRKGFKQYINGAGGYTQNANKRGAYIQYANGSVDATHKVLFFRSYPTVKPGAEIFVPKRAPREKMNAQGWVGISSAIVSMAAIIYSILK